MIGTMLILAAFALTVVIPAMPFIYFLFAVIEWVMSIFEAVVAMPLWALSFLNVSGEGFFGPKAIAGAWLILEIFIRPTIIVLSLIGTILIFNAAIAFLNDIYGMFMNTQGNYTFNSIAHVMLYIFIVYSIANSTFKMIDQLPNNIMRWIGENVQGFGGIMDAGAAEQDAYLIGRYADEMGRSLGGFGKNYQQRKELREEMNRLRGDDKASLQEKLSSGSMPSRDNSNSSKSNKNRNKKRDDKDEDKDKD